MDVGTGRIYPPDEYAERIKARELRTALDEHQEDFARREAAGKIVEVSPEVAQRQLLGQAEQARRRARKAAKAARKRNR